MPVKRQSTCNEKIESACRRARRICCAVMTLIMTAGIFGAYAQTDTRTQTFDSQFRSLQVKLVGNDYFPAIITNGNDDHITISFDELTDDVSYLRYSLVHCNSDWQPSSLVEAEYVDGFNYANIEDYEFSSGTFSHYVHYSFTLPNDNMRILLSGNYLVKVYREDAPDVILLQARFSVCENVVSVSPTVTSRTDIDYNTHNQQLSFVVNTKNYKVQNIYNDLKIYVSQNSRLDNEVFVSSPIMATVNTATFDHNRNLIFPAGNEFRRMETVATNYLTMGVERMQYHHPYYHATLREDERRADEPYLYDQTQMGRYTIRNADADNSAVGSDYIVTHFRLNTGGPVTGGKIYLDGEFTHHLFNSSSLMKYDPSTGCYVADLFLKQGAYNYQYLFVPDGKSVGNTSRIEGDKFQTVNEYLVRVYNRKPGERYDRFIGYGIAFSGK